MAPWFGFAKWAAVVSGAAFLVGGCGSVTDPKLCILAGDSNPNETECPTTPVIRSNTPFLIRHKLPDGVEAEGSLTLQAVSRCGSWEWSGKHHGGVVLEVVPGLPASECGVHVVASIENSVIEMGSPMDVALCKDALQTCPKDQPDAGADSAADAPPDAPSP